ncbi:MAG TPA: hypothetical protein VM537_33515, partial [Anaerolineae bacterium]|nr:hypothetical protein [Anaerolineae bacterium]
IIDPMLQDSGSRTATVQATLEEADWQSIRYTHQRPPRAHWLRGEAILASNTTLAAIFCIAPGESPGQGETPFSQGEQLAPSQAALNACEGHRYGRHNAPQGYFSIILAEGDDQSIEPADMTWVRLNVSATTAAQRGLTFSNERGLVREMNVRYDHTRTGLVKSVELLWERETSGTPAVTVLLPAGGLPEPEWEPPDTSYDPTPEAETFGDPPGKPLDTSQVLVSRYPAVAWGANYNAHYCSWAEFQTGTPTWTPLPNWASGGYERTVLIYGTAGNTVLAYNPYDYEPENEEAIIAEYGPLPLGDGSWSTKQTALDVATALGYTVGLTDVGIAQIAVDIRTGKEGHAWAVGYVGYYIEATDEYRRAAFVLFTRDRFTTIHYATVLLDEGEDDGDTWWTLSDHNSIAVDFHNGYVYAALAKTTWSAAEDPGWLRLYRSQDSGFSFSLAHEWSFNHGDDDYYGASNDWCADVWVPYVSDTSNGGTVFWTAQLRSTPEIWFGAYEPRIYRSQNCGLSVTNIGDDGGLPTCLIRLLGPWNSAERVWGLACMYDEGTTAPGVWTWRDGYGWSKWSGEDDEGWESFSPFGANIYTFGIIGQDGYLPEEVVWRQFPWVMDDTTIDTDKNFPENKASWMTFIP